MACRLTKTRWRILVGLTIVVDILQIVLDFFAVGVAINRFIDIAIGVALPLFFQTQGVSMANPKRILGVLAAFIGEMIPVVDALPLWTLDVLFTWSTVKAEEAIGKVPGGKMAAKAITDGENPENPDGGEQKAGTPPLPNDNSFRDTGEPMNSPQLPDRNMQDIRPRL